MASDFALNYPHYEIVFCAADAGDPVLPLIRELIARNPRVPARLLLGDTRVGVNPKLNNLVKGWQAVHAIPGS